MNSKKCSKCNRRPPIFFRKYSGERLCKRCFLSSIEDKVRTTINKYNMFKPDDRIAVALSGGKDSITLLYILNKIEEKFPESELIAITVDEGISGYRSPAVEIAKKNCKALGIEQKVVSFKEVYGYELDEIVRVSREKKVNISSCTFCGVLRRKVLNIAARELGADKIATGHNLDDMLQTFLINMLQGNILQASRARPVTPSSDKFVSRVKPLCRIPENEIALYAYLKGVEFQPYPCGYMYEAIRSEIRMMLNRLELNHPGIKFSIFKSIEQVFSLSKSREERVHECKICGEGCAGNYCQACALLLSLGLIKA